MVSPAEVLCERGLQGGQDGLGDGFDIGEAAGAGHAAGEVAAAGLDDGDAALAQDLDVGAGCRMAPHVYVHRRGDDDGRGGGEEHGGEEVVGEAVGHLGQHMRRCGRDDDRVGGLGLGDVLDPAFIVEARRGLAVFAPHGGDDLVAGERRERERLDELLGGASHHDANIDFILLERADEFSGLVGSDSAADSNDYAWHFSIHETPSPPRHQNLHDTDDKQVTLHHCHSCE